MAKLAFSKPSNDFYSQVWAVVRLVPYGRVTTYGHIARYLGSSRSSRLVGYAMNLSHTQPNPVPAHRVVNRNGVLSGKHYFADPQEMQQLLEAEGIIIQNDCVTGFVDVLWDPLKELAL